MRNQGSQADRGGDTADRGARAARNHHRARWIAGSIIVALAAIVLFIANFPTDTKAAPPVGFTPIRDDALAARYQPLFDCPAEYGPILALYYRAAKDETGIIHIAYHPVWAKEENLAPGFGAFLSRYLYTGGLSLQRMMFGPGDIEAISLSIEPSSGAVLQIDYETAANYDASQFSVTHEAVSQKGNFALPLRFSVVSWNHLFALEGEGSTGASAPMATSHSAALASSSQPPLSYFTPALWSRYGIWKNPQTILRKDRAHFVWERATAE